MVLGCACVQVPNSTDCTVAGQLANGMICAETNTGKTSTLTFDQTIEFLEPQAADPVKKLPARAGAMCTSSADYTARKNALEQACREMGTHCTYEMQKAIGMK